jgi:predicted ATPase
VTSREILHLQAEHVFAIRPLSLPDVNRDIPPGHLMQYAAVALFTQQAQTYQPSFQITPTNAETIVELCIRLDGLPLAIKLAAPHIRIFTPQTLLARITQDQHILKNDLRSVPERHHTLDHMIKWSYDLLSEPEKWFFQRFALFIGGAQIDTLEGCFNTTIQPPSTIVEIVTSMLNKSLLQRNEQGNDEPRFSMLETLRHYALDRLRASGEIQTQYRAYAMYYLALVEQAAPHLKGSEQAQWLAKLDQEVDNLREALHWLIEQQETELALRFCEAFGKFCGLRGYWNDERHWLKTVLSLPALPEPQQKAIRAKVLRRAGHLAYRLRDLPAAHQLLQQSIDYSREIQDWQNLTGALSSQGWVLYRQNEKMAAEQLLHECVEVAYRSEDNWVVANSLESLGRFMRDQDNIIEARILLQKSIAIARKHLDKESLARILTTQVTLEIAQNNLEQAMNVAMESHKLAQELGTKPLIALTIDTLGKVTLSQGNYIQAKQLFEERIAMAEEIGDISTISIRQLKLADIALALEGLDQE